MSDSPNAAMRADEVAELTGSDYPAEYSEPVAARRRRRLGEAVGIGNFGVNLVRVPPGVWSSQRHHHSAQDEFVYVLEGELVLVTDAGEQVLTAGMIAGFPAGNGDGHHMINRGERDAVYLEVGDRTEPDEVNYPEADMRYRIADGVERLTRRDGSDF